MTTRATRLTGFVLAFGVTAALAGCTAGQAPNEHTMSGTSGSDTKQVAPGVSPAQPNGKNPAPAVPVGQLGGQERKLVRTAKLALTAPDVNAVVDRARQIAVSAGGYTGAEHADTHTATLTLSVPADKLDAVLGQLTTAGLGTVTGREQSTQDVTEQSVDLDSRLTTQRASVERIRALLAKANSVGEVASVESELTTRESDLESLQRRREALVGSVAMSTVTVTVTAAPPAAAVSGGGFVGGLSSGWSAFGVFLGGVLTVLGAATPFLVALGVPAVAVYWWLRRRRRNAEPAPLAE